MTFKIIRFFLDPNRPNKVIYENLSHEEALAHCLDPESSSQTCRAYTGRALTKRLGAWFDGWTRES